VSKKPGYILHNYVSWPRVHKAFQIKDQVQAQVKNSYIMAFFLKTYFYYLTIDCWC